jgi:hypothetical protein
MKQLAEEGEALDWGADVAFKESGFAFDSEKVGRTLEIDDDCFPVWVYGSRILSSKDISPKQHPFLTFDLYILLHQPLQIRVPIPQNLSNASTRLSPPCHLTTHLRPTSRWDIPHVDDLALKEYHHHTLHHRVSSAFRQAKGGTDLTL